MNLGKFYQSTPANRRAFEMKVIVKDHFGTTVTNLLDAKASSSTYLKFEQS